MTGYNPQESLYKNMENLTKDNYSILEKELQSLTDSEASEILKYKPYIEANERLSTLIQAELLNLVKPKINGNFEVIDGVVQSIRQFKKEQEVELNDFKEYIKNYSELTYKEYIEMKYGKK